MRGLLESRDLEGLAGLARRDAGVLKILSAILVEDDELLAWRTVEAIGRAARIEAEKNSPDKVRETISRYLWLMNDESGGLLRRGPEAIGEILYNLPELVGEYGIMLVHFLREEPFERGAHWALARVAALKVELFLPEVENISPSMKDDDPYVRAHAALALLRLGEALAVESSGLAEDSAPIKVYDFVRGQMRRTSVAELVREGMRAP